MTARLLVTGGRAITREWAERFVGPDLQGCGPSIATLQANERVECEARLSSLFDGSLLWSTV